MIQDISPKVFHNEYELVSPQAGDPVFIFRQKHVLAAREPDGTVTYPTAGEFLTQRLECRLRYLFRIDDQAYFLYLPEDYQDSEELQVIIEGREFVPLMDVRRGQDMAEMFACMTAFHLFTWYDKNRFCGRCGKPLQHGERERMLRCPDCGNMVFPMIAPAVIVGVTDGERLLMTKYAHRAYTGWALIAGFCEIGETVEDTVRREVMEEAGVHVKNLRYVDSQPWGVDSNLLIGMFCGGDSLSVELKKKVDAFLEEHHAQIQVREGYGLTECVTASCLTPRDESRDGSIGIPFPDTVYAIVSPGTEDVLRPAHGLTVTIQTMG